ncbi:MAG TPA: hypothetical protein DGG94_10195 [Micromonosporaceae bacterium]|nr:hypothetical protein [Micromonosporaceae bacterium]HCU50153.1 hypothetical protein [Micromonosporaceae bacterium]
MITCSEATKQLWEYLDATLGAAAREAVEIHLAQCLRCCGELEFAEELRRFIAGATRDEVPADVLQRLNETLEGLGP